MNAEMENKQNNISSSSACILVAQFMKLREPDPACNMGDLDGDMMSKELSDWVCSPLAEITPPWREYAW